MGSSCGWAGKVLRVDLSSGEIEAESLDREWAKKYVGGSCFGARILFNEVPPEVSALSPDNVIILSQGPLSGTLSPASSRCEMTAKSPMSGIISRSNVGGNFGPQMKWAGYDLIIIKGQADKPVYLWIEDDNVELRDASHLWGQDVWATDRLLRESNRAVGTDIATLVIGPGGENLSLAACVMNGLARALAAGSPGAVWGSKRLKAIMLRGNKGVNIARPAEFLQLCQELRKSLETDPMYDSVREWGTIGWVGSALSRSPSGKHQTGGVRMEGIEEKGFEPLVEKHLACHGCPLHCSHFLNVKEGKYKGTRGEGLEGFVQVFGLNWKTNSAPFLTQYNNLCNQLGLSNSSVGPAITWAMELYKRGIISKEDTGGIEVTEGNEEAILELTRQMAYREGFGDVLADYPAGAAQKVGRGSEMFAAHNKGFHTYGFSPGIATSLHYTLGHNVATRGFDHLTGGTSLFAPDVRAEWGITRELLAKIGQERYGDATLFTGDPWAKEPRWARVVYDQENMMMMADITGICKFATKFNLIVSGMDLSIFAQIVTAATGEDFTADDLAKTAERELLIERAYNNREGKRRLDDYPFFLWWQLKYGKPNPMFNHEQLPLKKENYDAVLDEYYRLRGCDLKTAIPTRARLEELGLEDVADSLEEYASLETGEAATRS
ncbi:MAG: hypothetical protein HY530_03785 [Chloroflexi bacterium]|nr:hypothetical protein [Chloroflexota bacterium]